MRDKGGERKWTDLPPRTQIATFSLAPMLLPRCVILFLSDGGLISLLSYSSTCPEIICCLLS